MRSCTLGDFIKSLARGEETPQNEKEREHEFEKDFNTLVDELIDKVRKAVDEDFIKCEKAREKDFLEHGEKYHSFIEARIKRPLSIEETTIVDVAFELAFINGWCAHQGNGGNNDK